MDKLIQTLAFEKDADLHITARGVAYQGDMSYKVEYDAEYMRKCAAYDTTIARNVNTRRVAFVARYYVGGMLDVGVGDGAFINMRSELTNSLTFGFDINPAAVDMLRERNLYSDNWHGFGAFSFWDTLEHCERPYDYLKNIRRSALVFVSIPIFEDLKNVRASKHYRPGEHLYYFTRIGFINWMMNYGFRLVDESTHEMDAGRESIGAFAFVRDLPEIAIA